MYGRRWYAYRVAVFHVATRKVAVLVVGEASVGRVGTIVDMVVLPGVWREWGVGIGDGVRVDHGLWHRNG